jgi:transcriptional regulator with PAS, ATPase and Fis domain
MRIYSFFSILFFIFGALAVVIGGPTLFVSYEWSDPEIESSVFIFRVVIVLLFGSGFVISSLFFLVTRRKGFASYKRIIDRISSERSMSFNLNIRFPEQDEFGNLGKWLNKFVEQMREFDQIKVERLRTSQQKVDFLAEMTKKGIVIVSSESKITYANSHIIKSLDIGDKTIVGLPINKVIENETLEEVLEELKTTPKNQTLEDLRVKSWDVGYKTKIDLVPIISSDMTLMETMIIFHHLQKKRI